MDCDGLKKNLLSDLDGSLLGTPGSVISQSEYGWGSKSRGLGDFRIPTFALVNSSGSSIPPSSLYTFPGIVRNEIRCTNRSTWQAYECHGLNFAMMII